MVVQCFSRMARYGWSEMNLDMEVDDGENEQQSVAIFLWLSYRNNASNLKRKSGLKDHGLRLQLR